jgi:hypothetical protein
MDLLEAVGRRGASLELEREMRLDFEPATGRRRAAPAR